jgi:hypothetical protein
VDVSVGVGFGLAQEAVPAAVGGGGEAEPGVGISGANVERFIGMLEEPL